MFLKQQLDVQFWNMTILQTQLYLNHYKTGELRTCSHLPCFFQCTRPCLIRPSSRLNTTPSTVFTFALGYSKLCIETVNSLTFLTTLQTQVPSIGSTTQKLQFTLFKLFRQNLNSPPKFIILVYSKNAYWVRNEWK